MLTLNDLTLLKDALEMANKSNQRAQRASTRPEFKELYTKIETHINEIQVKIQKLSNDIKDKEYQPKNK